MGTAEIKNDLARLANKKRAILLNKYFKTGKGEYAQGDVFLGLTVPQTRLVAKKYEEVILPELQSLLSSKIHEERQVALMILSLKAKKASSKDKEVFFNFFLRNTKNINNWDLVDGSAPLVIGDYLYKNPNYAVTINGLSFKGTKILEYLAKSKNIWERRIAILSAGQFIKYGKITVTLKIAKMLLSDKHDLIHKAVGWMLREVGKRNQKALEDFLDSHYYEIPRTTLRYSIEKFSKPKRLMYLNRRKKRPRLKT